MQFIVEYIKRLDNEDVNEDELIEKLKICLDNGGDIDFLFQLEDFCFEICILHYFIIKHYALCVEYALSRGANILINMIWITMRSRNRNALELAVKELYFHSEPSQNSIFDMLKRRSLELYSTYGLTPLHVDCAVPLRYWSIGLEEYLQTIDVNATISTESPLWPGMNPILIAAEFEMTALVKRLLDLGADPLVCDAKGNTPLHYLYASDICDERLFAFDGRDTCNPSTGESHFHFACLKCPNTLEFVERYLDQGISPDLQINSRHKTDPDMAEAGLHIAVGIRCPELIRLLLKYGAAIDKKSLNGKTPVELISYSSHYNDGGALSSIQCMSLLIESGSNMERIREDDLDRMNNFYKDSEIGKAFLRCIARLTALKEDLVPKWLKDVYRANLEKCEWWNEAEYVSCCSEELRTLVNLGYWQVLDSTAVVKSDFEDKFGKLDSSNFEAYPIYGKLLETNTKRKLLEFINRKRRIQPAVPQLQRLFESKCYLPHLCAEAILWNMSNEEINQFVTQN